MYVVLLRYCVRGLVIFAAENCADSQKSAVHPKEREKAALMIQRAKLQIRRRRQESSKIVKETTEQPILMGNRSQLRSKVMSKALVKKTAKYCFIFLCLFATN